MVSDFPSGLFTAVAKDVWTYRIIRFEIAVFSVCGPLVALTLPICLSIKQK